MEREASFYRWDDLPKERLTDLLDRRFLFGQRLMLAHVYLRKGCHVQKHHHENEQASYVLEGSMRFWLGDNLEIERVLKAGDVVMIPPNLPHSAEALEDSLSLDVFGPPRQDWIDGTDAYLREQK
jgi:quercetin dioxygenase-like cupin family protein